MALTGFPRSGTTVAKRFLAEYPAQIEMAEYGHSPDAWRLADAHPDKVVVAKRTRFLMGARDMDLR